MNTASIRAQAHATKALDHAAYERFLPLVRRTAMRFARRVPRHITVADLVAYGWVGLMEAYRRADPSMPPGEFEAYASYRVRGAMLDYLRTLDPASRELRRSSRKVTEKIRELTTQGGRPPEEEEIAVGLGVGLDEYRALLERIAVGGMARLELLDLDDLEVDGGGERIDDDVSSKQLSAAVADAIESLPLRLQQVLALYYQEECTLREVGVVLGVSESRVSQLHSEAMHRLRALIGRQ
jgi:RNA polymerase sigma factor for flagellar operon FliA